MSVLVTYLHLCIHTYIRTARLKITSQNRQKRVRTDKHLPGCLGLVVLKGLSEPGILRLSNFELLTQISNLLIEH